MKDSFKMFDPTSDNYEELPNVPGNYLAVLRPSSELPQTEILPSYHTIVYKGNEYQILYTGISNNGIRKRDYKQHFTGNAGKSTLRKSLGSLMGFHKIPRDKAKPENGKTKFNEEDETKLSSWMKENLLLLYSTDKNTGAEMKKWEQELIAEYNPPLNIQENNNLINKEYREMYMMVSSFQFQWKKSY